LAIPYSTTLLYGKECSGVSRRCYEQKGKKEATREWSLPYNNEVKMKRNIWRIPILLIAVVALVFGLAAAAFGSPGDSGGNFAYTDECVGTDAAGFSEDECCEDEVTLSFTEDGCNGNEGPPDPKIEICHRNQGDPQYVVLEIATSALPAHLAHQWGADLYPIPRGGCPVLVVYGWEAEATFDCRGVTYKWRLTEDGAPSSEWTQYDAHAWTDPFAQESHQTAGLPIVLGDGTPAVVTMELITEPEECVQQHEYDAIPHRTNTCRAFELSWELVIDGVPQESLTSHALFPWVDPFSTESFLLGPVLVLLPDGSFATLIPDEVEIFEPEDCLEEHEYGFVRSDSGDNCRGWALYAQHTKDGVPTGDRFTVLGVGWTDPNTLESFVFNAVQTEIELLDGTFVQVVGGNARHTIYEPEECLEVTTTTPPTTPTTTTVPGDVPTGSTDSNGSGPYSGNTGWLLATTLVLFAAMGGVGYLVVKPKRSES